MIKTEIFLTGVLLFMVFGSLNASVYADIMDASEWLNPEMIFDDPFYHVFSICNDNELGYNTLCYYRTDNSGLTWDYISIIPEPISKTIKFDESYRVYVIDEKMIALIQDEYSDRVFEIASNDNGLTWIEFQELEDDSICIEECFEHLIIIEEPVRFDSIFPSDEIDLEQINFFDNKYPISYEIFDLTSGIQMGAYGGLVNAFSDEIIESGLLITWSDDDNIVITDIQFGDSQFEIEPLFDLPYNVLGEINYTEDEINFILPDLVQQIVYMKHSQYIVDFTMDIPEDADMGTHFIPVKIELLIDGEIKQINSRIEVSIF